MICTVDRSDAEANKALLCKHVCLVDEARVHAVKLAPMYAVDWWEVQEEDTALAACMKWLKISKGYPS